MLNDLEKKQMKLFFIMLVITTLIMGATLKVASDMKMDLVLQNLVATQMLMPAFSVFFAEILTEKREDLPFRFIITYMAVTFVMYLSSVYCILFNPNVDMITALFGIISFIAPIILWILYLTEKKDIKSKRKLTFVNKKESFIYCLIFVGLLALRTSIGFLADKEETLKMFKNASVGILWVLIVVYFISFYLFFGEEYGWRCFLQPKLQKIFGKRKGVLILGFIWGIWHIFISMYFYSPETFVQQAFVQIVFCIGLGIFIGLSYMVTENIWVPVIIHYINNNLMALLTGADFSNQVLTWPEAIAGGLINLVLFGIFIFSKKYSDKKLK